MRNRLSLLVFFCSFLSLGQASFGQGATGTLDLTARIAPTGARPEPVRQFTFYILTKSFADVLKEAAAQFPLEEREEFINNLKISAELKAWMKQHAVIDLTAPDVDKLITPDDVMNIPEFFAGYERSNSGGVTAGLPMPKYREADAEANPAKYFKLKQEYMSATKKFVESHLSTISGMETELGAVNPKYQWDRALQEHNQKVAQLAPDLAQTKYMVAKGDTDLDGHLLIKGLPPGNYWVSSLGLDAASGDRRLIWDVPATVQAGTSTQLILSNINGQNFNSTRP
ncbi:MAG TPA: hypothetical protein VNY24_09515 [Candidatus Acidoferrales bacterium]|jgi:hypothetical protein|nr:hypothetical protein [Candidatus Acidoferrales bacterium]